MAATIASRSCPWNKFAKAAALPELRQRTDLASPDLAELATLDDAGFRARFAGSPIKADRPRPLPAQCADRDRNSGETRLAGVAESRLADAAPLVRGAAVWALARLLPLERILALASGQPGPGSDGARGMAQRVGRRIASSACGFTARGRPDRTSR